MCPDNHVIRLTQAYAYYIDQLKPIRIKLEILGEIHNDFVYKRLAIFDCTCLLDNNRLCGTCSTSTYNMSSVAKLFQQRLFIYVKYDPQILENLLRKVHFFTGIVNLNADKLKREIKSVNFLRTGRTTRICVERRKHRF